MQIVCDAILANCDHVTSSHARFSLLRPSYSASLTISPPRKEPGMFDRSGVLTCSRSDRLSLDRFDGLQRSIAQHTKLIGHIPMQMM